MIVVPALAGPCDGPVGELLESFNSQEYSQTAEIATRMMADPESAQCSSLYVTRGRAFLMLDQTEKAVSDLERAAEISPRSCFVNIFLSIAYRQQRRTAIPVDGLLACLNFEPSNIDALFMLASVYWNNGDYDSAASTFGTIVALDPTDIDAKVSQASAFREAERFTQAEGVLNTILENHPDSPFAHEEMGQVLLKQARYDDSIAWFTSSLELSVAAKEHPELLANVLSSRALARFENGDLPEAANDVRRSIAYYESASAFLTEAKLAFEADRVDDACRSLAKADSLEPDDTDKETIDRLLQRCS